MRASLIAALACGLIAPVAPAEGAGTGPYTKADYPYSLIDRPLTLPRGMVEGRIAGVFTSQRVGIEDWDLLLGAAVGITDQMQGELSTAFSLDHSVPDFLVVPAAQPSTASWSRDLVVRLSYLAFDSDTFDVAPAITVPFHVDAGSRTLRRLGIRVKDDRGVVDEIGVESPARWVLGDHVWLEAGRHLATVTTDPGAAFLFFYGGLGLQATRSFATLLEMSFALVPIPGDRFDAATLDEVVPLRLSALLALCRWADLTGGLVLFNAHDGFDDYQLRVGLNVRI